MVEVFRFGFQKTRRDPDSVDVRLSACPHIYQKHAIPSCMTPTETAIHQLMGPRVWHVIQLVGEGSALPNPNLAGPTPKSNTASPMD